MIIVKKRVRRFAVAIVASAFLLPVAGTALAAGSKYSIHRTSGISWHSEIWVLMFCRKGYTAVHGGYSKPPAGLKIESNGASKVDGQSLWEIEVNNSSSKWLELHSWATCAKS